MADTPVDATTLYDERDGTGARSSGTENSYSDTPGIDVARAEREFDKLSRQLSRLSQRDASKGWGVKDQTVVTVSEKDLEKGGEYGEAFDLREYLTSSNDANERAGIKHKVRLKHVYGCYFFQPCSSTLALPGKICMLTELEELITRCDPICTMIPPT